MKRHHLIAAIVLGISACTTTAKQGSQPSSDNAEPVASGRAAASIETSGQAAAAGQADGAEGIVVVDTPDVPDVAVTEEEYDIPNGDERVCRRERRTGTHRAQRVCYTRAEIERMADKSRDVLDEMNRSSRTPIDQ